MKKQQRMFPEKFEEDSFDFYEIVNARDGQKWSIEQASNINLDELPQHMRTTIR